MLEPKDPRITRTLLRLETSLLELMKEKSFSKITVVELSKKADVNRATFYLHFYDKHELLNKLITKEIKKLKKSLNIEKEEYTYNGFDPHPVFIRLFTHIYEQSLFYQVIYKYDLIPQLEIEIKALFEDMVRRAIYHYEEEKLQVIVPKEITIPFISNAFYGVLIWWLKNDLPYTPHYLAKQLTMISTHGVFLNNPFQHQLANEN